jgi:hypothetical protein
MACLFFDQVNNYAKFVVLRPLPSEPSTDLSTVIVDNAMSRCQTKTYTNQGKTVLKLIFTGPGNLVVPRGGAYDARPEKESAIDF